MSSTGTVTVWTGREWSAAGQEQLDGGAADGGAVLGDHGQTRAQQVGEEEVVQADDGHLTCDGAALAEDFDGRLRVAGDQSGSGGAGAQGGGHRGGDVGRVDDSGVDHAFQGAAVGGRAGPEGGRTFAAGEDALLVADVGDALVAVQHQVPEGQADAGGVVGQDRVCGDSAGGPVHQGLWARNSSADLGMLRYLLTTLINASVTLSVDSSLRGTCQNILKRLAPIPTTVHNGQTVYALTDPGTISGFDTRPIHPGDHTINLELVHPGKVLGITSPAAERQIGINTGQRHKLVGTGQQLPEDLHPGGPRRVPSAKSHRSA